MMFSSQKLMVQLLALALFCTSSVYASEAFTNPKRPIELPETCNFSMEYNCPGKLQCYRAPEGVGYCYCYAYYALLRKPPSPDDPIDKQFECQRDWYLWTIFFIYCLLMAHGYNCVAIDLYKKFHYLVKTKQFKIWNTNGRMMGFLLLKTVSVHFVYYIQMANWLGIDPKQWFHDCVRGYLLGLFCSLMVLMYFEITVAWIDIILKSVQLKKTTSKSLIVTKWFLRFINTCLTLIFIYCYAFGYKLLVTLPQVIFLFMTIPAMNVTTLIICKVICPNMDKNHNNYKIAKAIRVFSIEYSFYLFGFILGVFAFKPTQTMGITQILSIFGWMTSYIYYTKAWWSYTAFGYRKALKDYDSKKGQVDGAYQDLVSATTAASTVSEVARNSTADVSRKSVLENELPKLQEEP